jgi:hypothetical protein
MDPCSATCIALVCLYLFLAWLWDQAKKGYVPPPPVVTQYDVERTWNEWEKMRRKLIPVDRMPTMEERLAEKELSRQQAMAEAKQRYQSSVAQIERDVTDPTLKKRMLAEVAKHYRQAMSRLL